MIWNESIECMDRESLRKIQSILFKKTVVRVYHDTPFYRKKMHELGVTPDDINSIDDIVKPVSYTHLIEKRSRWFPRGNGCSHAACIAVPCRPVDESPRPSICPRLLL